MSKSRYKGRCLCGKIKYVLNGTPVWIGYCHCESCRRATGAAAATHVGAHLSDIEFVQGKLKVFESSPGVRRGFCSDCGSPITYDSDRYELYMQIYIGSFDEPERLMPRAHVNYSERISWFDTDDALARFIDSGDDGTGSWKGS